MTEPLVCAIMLTRNRPQMAARAVMSWLKQSYNPARRYLYVLDSGTGIGAIDALPDAPQDFNIVYHRTQHGKTIGALRNYAIEWGADIKAEFIVHFDDDDYSHPNRIAEQVALLQSSGAECVGYNEAIFYDARPGQFCGAWRYRHPGPKYAIGASLAYTRAAWERVKFPDLPKPGSLNSEDRWFTNRVRTLGVSGIVDGEPRLIASVHGSNSANYSWVGSNKRLRAAEFDSICRERMKL